MKVWSIPLGRLFGVEVRVHATFLFLLLFLMLLHASVNPAQVPRTVILVAIIFFSVVAHEIGHAVAAALAGRPPHSVLLLPLGGITHHGPDSADESSQSVLQVSAIALAGPAVNLVIALLSAAIAPVFAPEAQLMGRPYIHPGNLVRSLVWVNAALALVNLLPAFPLDGGRVYRAILARRMDQLQATRYAAMGGQFFSMLFILMGIWNTWLMLAGFFLFVAAQLEDRTHVFQNVMQNVRMDEVMLTDFATLSPADTLEDALQKAIHSLQDDFPVVRGSDLVGVITRQRIVETLRSQGNGYVQGVMNRTFAVAERNETLATAFKKIRQSESTLIPVVENQRLIGIVTLQNVMRSIGLVAESRRLRRD